MVKSIALPTGITLPYAEQGLASGVPVVFLHGVTDSWRSFEPVLERLPPTVRALAVTQRGHGGSSKPAAGYGYRDLSEDVRRFMDALRLPEAVIVGHSMGSMVAQRFAADHPERVAGLVLMGAFRTIHGNAVIQEFWDAALATLEDPIDPAFVREFQVSTLARPVPPELLEIVVEESLLVPARVWRAAFRAFLDTPDFSPELARVTAPALLAWGDRDSYAGSADQEALRVAVPGARLLVYRGGGHAFHWEDPGRFANDLVAFLYERREQGRQEMEGARATRQFTLAPHGAE
jgi:pimeloyl-ACP methyl ester carboxylesterase